MDLLKMKCPSCNANLEINPALKEAYCEYCGSKIMVSGMQSSNQLGQPVADAHLTDMLKNVAPILSSNEELSASLSQKQALLAQTQNKLSKVRVPLIDNSKHNLFDEKNKKIYIIALIPCILLTCTPFIFLSIPVGIALILLIKGIFDKKKYESTISVTQRDIQKIQQLLSDNNEKLSQYNIDVIPAKYRNGATLEFFYEVLNDQRATNMQQAINIYEEELRNRKIDAMQQQQLENLQRIEALAQENAAMKAQLNNPNNSQQTKQATRNKRLFK